MASSVLGSSIRLFTVVPVEPATHRPTRPGSPEIPGALDWLIRFGGLTKRQTAFGDGGNYGFPVFVDASVRRGENQGDVANPTWLTGENSRLRTDLSLDRPLKPSNPTGTQNVLTREG